MKTSHRLTRIATTLLGAALLAACAGMPEPQGAARKENIFAVTANMDLIKFNAGKAPAIVAAGYTYNKKDDKLSTNFAIDRRLGALVMQGSAEGTTPVVSPNTGQLRTVGPLGLGELTDATFDIADTSGDAFAAVRTGRTPLTSPARPASVRA